MSGADRQVTLQGPERRGFILGMITAFGECLEKECKRLAFSPPFYPEDRAPVQDEARRICAELGIGMWLEENPDLLPHHRVHWWVLYKYPEMLDAYRELRAAGHNPARDLSPFYELLSYGSAFAPGADRISPRLRTRPPIGDPVGRLLFSPGDWPVGENTRRPERHTGHRTLFTGEKAVLSLESSCPRRCGSR